jgi:iron(III) transport system ATP-binding protein
MSEATVCLEALELRYGSTVAVDAVSLDVEARRLTGLVGGSGCGKTSLLRLIAGFEVPAAGTISIGGRVVAGNGVWIEPESRHVGMVFQSGALFPHLDVWRNVMFGVRSKRDGKERAREALRLVGLEDLKHRYPSELSGGQQQRVALARALAPSPAVILLDEPFANLDAALRERVRNEIRQVLDRAQITAVLVTHDQEEALSICDRVAVMETGRILQVGTPAEVYHHPATLAVAGFIGDGQLLRCRIRQGLVDTPVGRLRTAAPDGEAEILIRPEELKVVAGGSGDAEAELISRRYFGHDALDEVRLVSGQVLQVRRLAPLSNASGSTVSLRLADKSYPLYYVDSGKVAEACVEQSVSQAG